jgi:hypothetical protein
MCRRVALARVAGRRQKAPGAWPLTSVLPLVVSQRLRDTLLDVTQRLAGHRRAMAWEEEARRPVARLLWTPQRMTDSSWTTKQVSLASAVLYYGLTTASGSPTLGEEYCDLHTVCDSIASRVLR